ncbi:MAG: glycosyltransferase family 4 protein [Desulfobacca sp.]|nr:glycosyltransferase family 4 protein [Desulfobacca sp.]
MLIGSELFPIPPIRGGAAELFIEKAASCLTRYRPLIVSPADPDLPRQERRDNVEYIRVPMSGWRAWLYRRYREYFPLYDRQVAKLIHHRQPVLVHVHNRPLLALSLKQRYAVKAPVILHLHNLYNSLGKRERPEPGTMIPVEGLVACSQFVLNAEKNRLGLGAAAYSVIYNGVDVKAFRSRWDQTRQAQEVRHQYQLSDEPTVLYVGKLRESKGVDLILGAMSRVWRIIPDAVLVLVGGTEFGRGRTQRVTAFYKELCQQIDRAAGRIVLTGFIPPSQMPQAYLLGDLFVGPSQIAEGLGMVFLEASASGLPIIATRMGGIPEVVKDGLNGVLLEEKDNPDELAQKMVMLLEDRERSRKIGEQGRLWVQQNFAWQKIAQDLEMFYDRIIANSRGQELH